MLKHFFRAEHLSSARIRSKREIGGTRLFYPGFHIRRLYKFQSVTNVILLRSLGDTANFYELPIRAFPELKTYIDDLCLMLYYVPFWTLLRTGLFVEKADGSTLSPKKRAVTLAEDSAFSQVSILFLALLAIFHGTSLKFIYRLDSKKYGSRDARLALFMSIGS